MRDYIPCHISIDGRTIPYRIVTVYDYLVEKDIIKTNSDYEAWIESDKNYEIYERLSQLLAIKQSRFLLYHTSHSCQSLTDNLKNLEYELINDLKELNFDVDMELIEAIEW